MTRELNTDFVLGLYKKYINDLKKVREYQKKLYCDKGDPSQFEKYFIYRFTKYIIEKIGICGKNKIRIRPQFHDIEAEITYLFIREFKPKRIVEISPCDGWSTSWILQALKDNGFGKLYSYDIIDDSTKTIPRELTEKRWIFVKGDIKRNIDKLPKKIDYLFIDCDHSAAFAQWYIRNIFPKIKNGTLISVHDVFQTRLPVFQTQLPVFQTSLPFGFGEGKVIINWLKQRGIPYFTASPAKEKTVYNEVMRLKNKLNIGEPIYFQQVNPMIFFFKK